MRSGQLRGANGGGRSPDPVAAGLPAVPPRPTEGLNTPARTCVDALVGGRKHSRFTFLRRTFRQPACWVTLAGLVTLLIATAAHPNKEKQPQAPVESKDAAGSTESSEPAKEKNKDRPKKNPLAGCTLCHVDIEDEYVESEHFHEKVACIECHGSSKGHVADENNDVKPDEMFARKDVDRLCSECHDCERKIPSGWSKLPLDKRKVCSECHVAHEFAESAE